MALVLPPTTVTVDGTTADGELLFSLTTNPPFGAGPARITDPTELVPPKTVAGKRLIEVGVTTSIVRTAVVTTEPLVALIVESTGFDTVFVVMLNVADDFPLAILTLAGTNESGLLLDS